MGNKLWAELKTVAETHVFKFVLRGGMGTGGVSSKPKNLYLVPVSSRLPAGYELFQSVQGSRVKKRSGQNTRASGY